MMPINPLFRPIVSFRPTGGIFPQTSLGKVHQLFGNRLNTIIEELNETLAA